MKIEIPIVKTVTKPDGEKVMVIVVSAFGVIYLGALCLFLTALTTIGWMLVKVIGGSVMRMF